VPLLIVGYLCVSIALKPANQTEIFPFFVWNLFPRTADVRIDAAILVRSVNGEVLDPPRFYYDMKHIFSAARTGDPGLMKLVRRLVRAERAGDTPGVDALRRIVENTFMREATHVEYDLVIVRYDPIVRYQSGVVDAIETVRTFEKGTP